MKWYGLFLSLALAIGAAAQTTRLNSDPGTPLLSAILSLQLARAQILEADPEAAAAALRTAAQQLASYEILSPGPQAMQAEYIRRQILDQIARMHDDPRELVDRIDYLWLAPVNHWYYTAIR
jgi:hypothetical protein